MSMNEILEDLVEVATAELFAHLGTTTQRCTETYVHTDLAALIGFSGPQICGTLCIGASAATLDALTPAEDRAEPDSRRQWVSEMSNQLLGRFKGKLLRYGVKATIALPRIVDRAELQLFIEEQCPCVTLAFQTTSGVIGVWCTAELSPGVQLVASKEPREIPTEGSLTLFRGR